MKLIKKRYWQLIARERVSVSRENESELELKARLVAVRECIRVACVNECEVEREARLVADGERLSVAHHP